MDTDFAGEYRSLADPGHLADVESDPKKVGRGMTSPCRADLHLWLDCFHRAHCTVLVQDKQLQPRGTTHLQLLFNYFELLSARGYRDTVTRKWSWTEATCISLEMFETRHSGRRGATFQEDTESQYLHLQRQGTKIEEHRGNVLYDFDPKIDESAITLGGWSCG